MAFYMKPGRGPMMKTGQGIPQTFQSPEKQAAALYQKKQTPKDGDKLPSYEVKSTKSVNTPGKTTTKKTTSNYDAAVKSEGTTILNRPATAAETAAANKKRAEAKKKDASASTTTTTPASTKTVDTSETVTLGKETANQVKKRGNTNKTNARDKRTAIKNAAYTQAAADSTASSKRDRKRFTRDGEIALSKKRGEYITKRANKIANRTLSGKVSVKERDAAFPLDGKSAGTRGGTFSEEDFQ